MSASYSAIQNSEVWAPQFDGAWIAKEKSGGRFCSHCCSMRVRDLTQPVDVVLRSSLDPDIKFVGSKYGFCFIVPELLELVQRVAPEVLWSVGHCRLMSGERISTHVTAFCNEMVTKRQVPPTSIEVCPECGTIRPWSGTADPCYLLSHETRGRSLVVDRTGWVMIRSDLTDRVPLDRFDTLSWDPIEVLDLPRDGLRYPGDPSFIAGREVTGNWP